MDINVCAIDGLRQKMARAGCVGLRFDKDADVLSLLVEQTQVERSIFICDGQAYVRTSFRDADRTIVKPISIEGAAALIDTWHEATKRLAIH